MGISTIRGSIPGGPPGEQTVGDAFELWRGSQASAFQGSYTDAGACQNYILELKI